MDKPQPSSVPKGTTPLNLDPHIDALKVKHKALLDMSEPIRSKLDYLLSSHMSFHEKCDEVNKIIQIAENMEYEKIEELKDDIKQLRLKIFVFITT